jgi:DNA replication protein DnaC
MSPKNEGLRKRAADLRLHGVLAHWSELNDADWLSKLIDWEEQVRAQRSLERRLSGAHIGRFKSIADFDWAWPKQCDRAAIEALMTLEFMAQSVNVVLRGNNGVGKSMLAKNVAHQALVQGYTVRFTTAGEMLGELAAMDSDASLRRRLRHYVNPDLLVIDEIGYLSYSNQHADLLFELVNRRYESKSTIVTTNKAFADWGDVFPNAACVVSLIDRLVHHSEVIGIEGESYRLKDAQARSAEMAAKRKGAKSLNPS